MRVAGKPLSRGLAALVLGLSMAAAASATEHTVNIVGLTFDPADLTIEVGDTVTWVNDGGLHNVAANDGSFTSGDPSTDMWVYSHTFNQGGTFPYLCQVHSDQGMVGTVTVEGIFGDSFDSGDSDAWDSLVLLRENCSCYFSGDCAGGGFCDYGLGGFTTEDICTFMNVKPNGVPGEGCNEAHSGNWGANICDGLCSTAATGSTIGHEDRRLLAEGAKLWSEAMLRPSEQGGGPPDSELVERVTGLGFELPHSAYELGRQVADLMIVAGTPEFYDYFCHYESHPDALSSDKDVDLSGAFCQVQTARLMVEALVAEIGAAGAAAEVLDGLDSACADWQDLVSSRCPEAERARSCIERRVVDTAIFVTTPVKAPGLLELTASASKP